MPQLKVKSNFQSGSLHCQILGLLGFSRLCQGYTYEVQYKLCKQSWKAKCKLEPLGQSWIESEFTFQINYKDDLKVKVTELGTAVRRDQLVGSIVCPVQNFLNITPQAYLLPLNTTGTIKLKLGVIWRPNDISIDMKQSPTSEYNSKNMVPLTHLSHNSSSASSPTSPTINQEFSVYPPQLHNEANCSSNLMNQLSRHLDKNHGHDRVDNGSNRVDINSNINQRNNLQPNYHYKVSSDNSDYNQCVSSPGAKENLTRDRQSSSFKEPKRPQENPNPHRKTSLNTVPVNNIKVAQITVKSNSSTTNKHQNNFQSSVELPKHVTSPIYKSPVPAPNQSSFDLKKKEGTDVLPNVKPKQLSKQMEKTSQNDSSVLSSTPVKALNAGNLVSLKMNEKSSITEIIDVCQSIVQILKLKPKIMEQCSLLVTRMFVVKESMVQLKKNLERKASLTDSITDALSTFSFLSEFDEKEKEPKTTETQPSIHAVLILRKQWKKCYRVLYHHMCSLKEVIDFSQPPNSPLKEKEKNILPQLTKQLEFINLILKIASTPDEIELLQVCSTYCGSSTLSNTWEVSSDPDQPLYCTKDGIITTLKILEEHARKTNPSHTNVCQPDELCLMALSRLQEGFKSDNEILSLFQFISFFKKLKSNNVSDFLMKLRQEVTTVHLLQSNDLIVLTALQQLGHTLAEPSCIHQILILLVKGSTLVNDGAVKCIIKMYEVEANQNEILSILLSSLEENDVFIRAGACVAIAKLRVYSAVNKLKYLLQTDHATVKEAASIALAELGQLKM